MALAESLNAVTTTVTSNTTTHGKLTSMAGGVRNKGGNFASRSGSMCDYFIIIRTITTIRINIIILHSPYDPYSNFIPTLNKLMLFFLSLVSGLASGFPGSWVAPPSKLGIQKTQKMYIPPRGNVQKRPKPTNPLKSEN